jgi:hypothetical protein
MNPFAHFEDQFGHLKLSDNDAALHVFLAGWNSAMMEMMQRVNKMPFQNDTRASFAVYFQSQMVNVDAIEKPAQFDPSAGMQISKVWWDGEKLMAKPIPLEDLYRPAPVQEPVAIVSGYYGGQCVILPVNPSRIFNSGTAFYTSPPAAQPAPDLLNALKRIVDEPNNTMSDGKALKEIIRIARAAIAKATGEQA